MNIRLATHNDVQAISTLLTDFFAYNAEQQPHYYVVANESGKYPSMVIDSDNGDVIVAEADQGVIIGLLHIEEDSTPPYSSVRLHRFACIVDFIVSQQYRKNGIGHLLLEEAKRWAQSRNLEYLELMVLENNYIGRDFYEEEMFTTVSRTMRLDI